MLLLSSDFFRNQFSDINVHLGHPSIYDTLFHFHCSANLKLEPKLAGYMSVSLVWEFDVWVCSVISCWNLQLKSPTFEIVGSYLNQKFEKSKMFNGYFFQFQMSKNIGFLLNTTLISSKRVSFLYSLSPLMRLRGTSQVTVINL